MGKDSTANKGKGKDAGGKGKDAGGKGKGGGEEKGAKGKGKAGKDDLGTCTYVKGMTFASTSPGLLFCTSSELHHDSFLWNCPSSSSFA
jgi:hypothetical protein